MTQQKEILPLLIHQEFENKASLLSGGTVDNLYTSTDFTIAITDYTLDYKNPLSRLLYLKGQNLFVGSQRIQKETYTTYAEYLKGQASLLDGAVEFEVFGRESLTQEEIDFLGVDAVYSVKYDTGVVKFLKVELQVKEDVSVTNYLNTKYAVWENDTLAYNLVPTSDKEQGLVININHLYKTLKDVEQGVITFSEKDTQLTGNGLTIETTKRMTYTIDGNSANLLEDTLLFSTSNFGKHLKEPTEVRVLSHENGLTKYTVKYKTSELYIAVKGDN